MEHDWEGKADNFVLSHERSSHSRTVYALDKMLREAHALGVQEERERIAKIFDKSNMGAIAAAIREGAFGD